MHLRAVASALIIGLAACSSGSTLPSEPSPRQPPAAGGVEVPLRVFIPTRVRHGHFSNALLHQHFIAINSAGIVMTVYPHGLRLHPVATLTGNISSTSPTCKAVSGGRTCSFVLSIPPGTYDFVLKTYDQQPSSGVIPHTAKQLGAAVDTAKLATGKANTLNLTVGGVVARTFVHLPPTDEFHAIVSRSLRISIGALDADGNLIATDTYVDSDGNPVKITPQADSEAGKTITFSPVTLAAPQPNGVTLQYSALAATEAQLRSGFATRISASTGSEATTGKLYLGVFPPTVLTYVGTDPGPHDIAVLNGRWVVSASSSSIVDYYYNTIGAAGFLPGGAHAYGVAPDAGGNVWFTETGSVDQLGVLEVAEPTPIFSAGLVTLPSGAAPVGLTYGPDGAMWFTEQGANAIGRMDLLNSDTVTSFPLQTSSAGAQGITTGPDGALWFTECQAGKIGRIPVNATNGSSAQVKEFTVPLPGGAFPLSIVAGNDGALWFTDNFSAYIGRITTSGVITRFAIPSGKAAGQIAVAPDGSMWFTEPSGDKIGRILTSATTAHPGIIEFNSLDSGSEPYGITIDAYGVVYYTEYVKDRAVEFQ